MGNLLYSRKKNNAKEQLETIEDEIHQIDTYKLTAFIRQKNYLALIYFLFILIYPSGLAYIYFTFNTVNRMTILYSFLFIISLPMFLYLIRKYLHLYFRWIIENNNIRLVQLLKEKKQILSKVQETETFNDAKSILEKYDPSLLRNLSLSLNNLSQIESSKTIANTSIRDRRNIDTYNRQRQSLPHAPQSNRNYMTQPSSSSSSSTRQTLTQPTLSPPPPPSTTTTTTPSIGYRQRTIKPILPQNRSTVEKLIDYMFNDGPNNRYALICPNCSSHNGMALPDEFDYIAYICAYCGTFNPSRKIRPTAPKMIQQKAIEAPSSPSLTRPRSNTTTVLNDSNVKIFELSSVLNKTNDSLIRTPHIEEPDDNDDDDDNRMKSSHSDKNDKDVAFKPTKAKDTQPQQQQQQHNERIRSIDSSSDDE
ncbi:zinc-ribbon metal-binding protein lunapark [Dermatophagoides farinae]|uniref:zinc-ribbon metal-binding protein lunapark n=1 Tax=Dermatophagoides farinae TaxID=6954 RepID=UPI003F60D5E8